VYVDIPFGTLQPQRPRPGTRLDATDRRLVTLLSADGRMSYAAIGAALGISAPAARKRVVGMLEDGMLRIGATPVPAKTPRSGRRRHRPQRRRPRRRRRRETCSGRPTASSSSRPPSVAST
jgi:predicted ArsR family transcriptional regulator